MKKFDLNSRDLSMFGDSESEYDFNDDYDVENFEVTQQWNIVKKQWVFFC